MLPTPDYSADFEKIYEPSEDTFLILDLLEQDLDELKNHTFQNKIPLCVEIGTGTGIITTFLQKHVLQNKALYLTTDLNNYACATSIDTSRRNNGNKSKIDSIQCDLTSSVRKEEIDLLIFNPPYVPSEAVPEFKSMEELETNPDLLVDLALCGGHDGMIVTNRLLASLRTILAKNGVALILFCARNHPEKVIEEFMLKYGDLFAVDLRIHRKAGWEVLSVYRFVKK